MVFAYIKGCWTWLASWVWTSATPIPNDASIQKDIAARNLAISTLVSLLENKLDMDRETLVNGVTALVDAKKSEDFSFIFRKMWDANPKMHVEMIRCLESDLCTYFGVDASFKRLCFRIGHYLDDSIYDLFTFPEADAEFIKSKNLSRGVWTIIGIWVLDGTDGLKRFAKTLAENEYGDAVNCIRRERCRDMFGISRIPDYIITEDGFVLSQSLPCRPTKRSDTYSTQSSYPPQSTLPSMPSLHSSLMQGLPS